MRRALASSGEPPKKVMARGIVTQFRRGHPVYHLRMAHAGIVIQSEPSWNRCMSPQLGPASRAFRRKAAGVHPDKRGGSRPKCDQVVDAHDRMISQAKAVPTSVWPMLGLISSLQQKSRWSAVCLSDRAPAYARVTPHIQRSVRQRTEEG